jgi:putative nucleotidyltransferase with HDIG domain
MTNYLRFLITAQVVAAGILLAAAIALYPLGADIGGIWGLLFWIGLTLIASVFPIKLPAGISVSVGSAPVLATMVLGGPVAAGLVAIFGTFDTREVRLRVPWYGTLSNHAQIAAPALLSGIVYVEIIRVAGRAHITGGFASFAAVVAAGVLYNALNNFLAAVIVSARSGLSLGTVWSQDVRIIASNVVALVPIGWLMAQVFQLPDGVGWWATAMFMVPLFTTRLAYARYVETRELFEQTIGALANAVDARDRYTRGHSQRVSHISEAMCRVMGLGEPEIEKIKWAGLLHDIGKIGIRDNVLLKPGPLDREERILMNQHPSIGAEIVAPAQQLSPEAPLIRAHHEWFNGSGYPDGQEALDIPLGARILTIADAYEAMTSSRPYRKTPLTHEQAVGELEKFTGIQFDPDIVPVLVGLDREILDRPPDRPDELPTMLHADDPRDREERERGADAGVAAATALTTTPGAAPVNRPSSDPGTPTDRKGNPPRQALASDDVS